MGKSELIPTISIHDAVVEERRRCETICLDLEIRWRKSAERLRREGTWNTGWPFKGTFVAPKWEQAAKDTESAADGLAAVRKLIAAGATPLPPAPTAGQE